MLIPKTRKEIYQAYLSGDTHLELPKPVTRDEIILYNACINGAGTNPSWNDLTDKPFGETEQLFEVLSERECAFSEFATGVYSSQLDYVDVKSLSVGDAVSVLFDGNTYELIVGSEGEVIYVGNISLAGMGTDTGEPFVIALIVPQQNAMVVTASSEPVHTIAVYEVTETIKPLDPKYIVLTSPNGTKYNLSVSDSGTLSATAAT